MSKISFPIFSIFLSLLLSLFPEATMADETIESKIEIPCILIGDPGNAANPITKQGAVAEVFSLAEAPISVFQYCAFLNAVAAKDPCHLYKEGMENQSNLEENIGCIQRYTDKNGSYYYKVKGNGNLPVAYLSWLDTARFCNWMSHNQPVAPEGPETTETGSYTLNWQDVIKYYPSQDTLIPLNPGATWFIPSENHLNKAACYQGNQTSSYASHLTYQDSNHVITHYGVFEFSHCYEWTSTHSLQAGLNGYCHPIPFVTYKWSENSASEKELEKPYPCSERTNVITSRIAHT